MRGALRWSSAMSLQYLGRVGRNADGICSSKGEKRRSMSFWSWLSSTSGKENAVIHSHLREDGTAIPMLESSISEIRMLGEQYAANGKGCGACKEPKTFSCPYSGFPTHCKEECYRTDKAYQKVANDLKMVYEDMVDLRSGRKFPEFDFPGPPVNEFSRTELIHWRAFLSDRRFNGQQYVIGNARTDEERYVEERSMRHISSVFTYPLTIAHAIYWNNVLGDPGKLDRKDEDGNLVPWRITILGARAEAKLPLRAWVELNAIFPEAAFHIHIVGPEVPASLNDQVKELNDNKLTIAWTTAMYQDIAEYYDVPDLFVAFNSGFGMLSELGTDTWSDALDMIFNKTGFKPLLLTSHSKEDSGRDYAYLARRNDCRFYTHPAENPFMSLRKDAAVNNLQYVINSNHTYAVARGSPPSGVIPGGSLLELLKMAMR